MGLLYKIGHHGNLPATRPQDNDPQPGSSVEYFNEEAGAVWVERVTEVYSKCIWLDSEPEEVWPYRRSIRIMKELMKDRMYPTTLKGLERAMRAPAK